LGGDEFVVVAHHNPEGLLGSPLATKILTALKEPIELDGNQVSLSASIGIAISPQDGVEFDTLNQKADQAMYQAKDSGRNNYCYFNKDMTVNNKRQLKIAQELRRAIPNNQLSLHFQSKQSLVTGEITGAEALLRWNHPDLGNVSPVDFIPIAEKSGAINELGEWVLNEAIRACRHWHDLGFNTLPISVNVSSIQFKRGMFESLVKDTLLSHNLSGEFLILELTESMLLDVRNELAKSMQSLRAMGVRLAIDDFGTGYSNLGYLQKFDISMLKVDRSFVSKIDHSSQDLAIVKAIISMSKSLDMEVVAEGIETQNIVNELLRLGCQTGQGYFWSKPIEEQAFINYLKSHAAKSP
jgi:EAL domain-containing protein (putative c-di-GMP-specific phosphodiesterase class I)